MSTSKEYLILETIPESLAMAATVSENCWLHNFPTICRADDSYYSLILRYIQLGNLATSKPLMERKEMLNATFL